MKQLKPLLLCLVFGLLLTSCSGKDEKQAADPALATQTTAPAPAAVQEENACKTQPDPGPCKAQIEKFYFDATTHKCTSFTYGGCQGAAPFDTLNSCQSACETIHTSANGCVVNGLEYQPGETWAQGCNTCTCATSESGPMASCTDTPCDASTTPNDTTLPGATTQPFEATPNANSSNTQGS